MMAGSEIKVDESPLEPGTSKPVHIRVESTSEESRKVEFEVTDEKDVPVQETKEIDLPGDVDQIAWFVEAPAETSATSLKLRVRVNGEQTAEESIPVGSPDEEPVPTVEAVGADEKTDGDPPVPA